MSMNKISMYVDYCIELDKYDPDEETYPINQAKQVAKEYLQRDDFVWTPIYDGIDEVGFLITADDLPFFGNGKYICEAYIRPDHRKRGLMTQTVQEMLKKCSIVHLEVFMANPAIWFWTHMFSETGFKEIVAEPSPLTHGAMHWAYEKRGS